jgi:hypothetical protein
MAFWSRFFGSAGSQAAGFAIGATAVPSLIPAVQFLENEAWQRYPVRPPDAYVLALGVAQGQVDPATAQTWANEQGIGDGAFAALVDAANVGPALGQAYQAWRRGALSERQFERATKRLGIESEWVDALKALKQNPLQPDTIANAVHRGIMRDPSLIVREPPTTAGRIEQVPPSSLEPTEEAAWSGIDHERLRVEVGTTGLPPGLVQMLQLLNRGEVTEDDVRRAVAQSNVRNEYMDVVLALRRHLLTPHEYEEAALRGIMSRAAADDGAALSGMTREDARLLFEIMGRPVVVHQITTGLARGGTFGGTYSDVPEPYRDAIRRSNIRPEYARLAYANRYTYPSAFVLRGLAESGDLGDTASVEQILLEVGWKPSLAALVAAKWQPSGTAADPHIGKANTQVWTALHKSYVGDEADVAKATEGFDLIGVPTIAQSDVLARWDFEKSLVRKQLSAAQIKRAYSKKVNNEATGSAWTRDDAVAALMDLGYSPADASTFLDL